MPTFTDSAGRTWPVTVTLPVVVRAAAALDLDLLAMGRADTPPPADVVRRALWLACRDEARARGVAGADFLAAVATPSVLAAGANALVAAARSCRMPPGRVRVRVNRGVPCPTH